MKILARFLVLGLVLLSATACSRTFVQEQKFGSRQEWHDYIDGLDIHDSMKQSVKDGTEKLCGWYINNVVPYLELKGDPVKALVKRYGMKAEVIGEMPGVDIRPAVDAAVADLIAKGDLKAQFQGRSNSRYLQEEEASGRWPTQAETIGSARRRALEGDFKRAPGERTTYSQVDTGK